MFQGRHRVQAYALLCALVFSSIAYAQPQPTKASTERATTGHTQEEIAAFRDAYSRHVVALRSFLDTDPSEPLGKDTAALAKNKAFALQVIGKTQVIELRQE